MLRRSVLTHLLRREHLDVRAAVLELLREGEQARAQLPDLPSRCADAWEVLLGRANFTTTGDASRRAGRGLS